MTTTSTVSTSGSTSYLTGTISGLDTDSLIEAAVAQKTARADTLDAKVTANTTKISAYQSLQSLLTDITDSLSALKSVAYSSLSTSGNAFDEKSAYLTASDGSDATDVIAVSADDDATAASYAITITQLAKAMKVASTAQDASAALGVSGDFTIGVEAGTSATIAITSDMTLTSLAAAINAQSGTTGVNATLLKVDDGDYRLVLSASDTDVDIQVTDNSGAAQAIGLTDTDGAFANVLQAAQPAIVTIDGLEVTSASNQLTDTIPGLSISLLQATTGQTITLDIEPNYEDVKTAITDFIDAYNALRDFIDTNQTVGSDGTVADDAVLFADSILRGVTKQLSGVLGQSVAAADDTVSTLASLGITLNADNQLELSDETTLDNLLLENLDSLQGFFETKFTTSDSALKLLKNDTSASLSFTLDVSVTDGAITDVTVGGESGLFTVSGNRIVGASGTIYEGLSFALVATQSTSIDVSLQQGFADLVTTLLNSYADSSTGVIQKQIQSLNETNAALSDKSDQIRDDAETYRTKLVQKYSAMEQELYAAQVLQQQIKAILGSSSDDDE
ncbi:flagellar filament capping protein FliD [Caulobacter segnis]|uniref:flagellar filament capping protein FliD n=1 Tax=Caulobacter segnis TaxID=88688 RepID=UPI001CC03FD4|nr:flagellar filament capping protein FliD [Caulobacter segnis]UAL10893.1 flagellar filament capping protein FliD [Caulobacter segnis]